MGTITRTVAGTPVTFSHQVVAKKIVITAKPEGGDSAKFTKVGKRFLGKFSAADGEVRAAIKLMNGRFVAKFGNIGYNDSFGVPLSEISEAANAA